MIPRPPNTPGLIRRTGRWDGADDNQAWSPRTPPAATVFDPATGFPWNQDQGELFVVPQFWPDPTTDLLMAFAGPPLNAVSAQAFAAAGGEEFVASQVVVDDTPGDPGLYPPVLTAFVADGGEVQAVPDDDPSVQSWSVGPPQNAVVAQALTGEPEVWQQSPTDDLTAPSWTVGPPPELGTPHNLPDESSAVTTTDDTAQSYPIQPPSVAAFDPATGFPWSRSEHERFVLDQMVEDPDFAITFGVSEFDPRSGTAWQPDEAERFVDARLASDDTAQSYPIQPPAVATVTRLTAFAVEGGEVQQQPTLDNSIQAWPVGPPQNATQALAFNQPDEAREVPVEDPTVPTYAIQPPAYTPVFQSTAWAVDGGEQQAVPTEDPSVQSWAVGPPQNATQLGAWTPDPQLTDGPPATDDTAQAWAIQPPSAAFDPATVAWTGRDDIVQPTWWTSDDTTQSWSIGSPLVPGVFNQPDEPIAPPAWLIVDALVPWTAPLALVTVVTGGRGPDSGGATAATPGGWAVAPTPAGGASASVPGGSANNPRPGR